MNGCGDLSQVGLFWFGSFTYYFTTAMGIIMCKKSGTFLKVPLMFKSL